MTKFQDQRVSILVDAENLEIAVTQILNGRIDYSKLLARINNRCIIRALYFKPKNKLTEGLRRVVENRGFEVKTPPKNVDCWLTIDAVTLSDRSDVIVLVGGDADYLPLVWYLKSKGVKVELWMIEEHTSKELISYVDEFVPITHSFLLIES